MLFLFMVEHHTYHIKNHILHKDTLKRAMLLINSKYTSLSLSALRLLRKIIGKGDDSYNSHLIKVFFRNKKFANFYFKKSSEGAPCRTCGGTIQKWAALQSAEFGDFGDV